MHAAIREILTSKDVEEQFAKNGVYTTPDTPAEFKTFLKGDLALWAKIAKEGGVAELKKHLLEERTLDWVLERSDLDYVSENDAGPEAAPAAEAAPAPAAEPAVEEKPKKKASKKAAAEPAAEAAPATETAEAAPAAAAEDKPKKMSTKKKTEE